MSDLVETTTKRPNFYCYDSASQGGGDAGAVKLRISKEDRFRFDSLPSRAGSVWITVTDLDTGLRWDVRRFPCGLSCYCAAQAKKHQDR